MKVLKKIKEMMPITNKKFKEVMIFYEDMIEGLLLSEQQHCQIETELLKRVNMKKPVVKTEKKETNNRSYQ